MKAGRELDALIADKVMGWMPLNDTSAYVKKDNPKYMVGILVGNFKPSTNISDAWLVVEEMERRRLRYHLSRMKNNGVMYWENDFEDEDRSGRYFNGKGETVPEAICKAALKSCGVEVEG